MKRAMDPEGKGIMMVPGFLAGNPGEEDDEGSA